MSDPVWLHRRQPTRLLRSWDSPGKNTGVGCHFLLQCMKVKSESEVAQSCPTLRDRMDCNLPGSSVHEIFQARVLEWCAIAISIWRINRILMCVHFYIWMRVMILSFLRSRLFPLNISPLLRAASLRFFLFFKNHTHKMSRTTAI